MRMKLKGFTLIELIVVMAIFGLIMAAAVSLMRPTSRIMINAEVRENGSAAVSNISNYLESQLATAEYVSLWNEAPSVVYDADSDSVIIDSVVEDKVKNFMNAHYTGILRSGSTPENVSYASGKVHVLIINNSPDGEVQGKISSCVYSAQFGNDGSNADIVNFSLDSAQEFAVNRAYYDSFKFQIRIGDFKTPEDFETSESLALLNNNFKMGRTMFSILSKTTNRQLNSDYNFVTNAPMALINMLNRNGVPVDTYYAIAKKEVTDASGTSEINYISDITDNSATFVAPTSGKYAAALTEPDVSGLGNGYCIIYSYANEIDTTKK